MKRVLTLLLAMVLLTSGLGGLAQAADPVPNEVGVNFSTNWHYGVSGDDIPKLVEGAMKQERLFVPNPRNLTEEDVRNIYESAF